MIGKNIFKTGGFWFEETEKMAELGFGCQYASELSCIC